jgi:nucleoside-triphosphatase
MENSFRAILDFWLASQLLIERILLLTGRPGVGKTSVMSRFVELMKNAGYAVGGMVSREVRQGSNRVGFEIVDLASGKKGWLARVSQKSGTRVGKYWVNIQNLEAIGVEAILDAVKNSDVIAIDEIGPMELKSQKFKDAVSRAAEGSKLVIAVVHWKAGDVTIDSIKARDDVKLYDVTAENRGTVHLTMCKEAEAFLSESSKKRI